MAKIKTFHRFGGAVTRAPGTLWLVDGVPHLAVAGLSDADSGQVYLVSLVDGQPYSYPNAFDGATWFCGTLTLQQIKEVDEDR